MKPPVLPEDSDAKPSDPDYMLSLARGLAVIRAFGDGRGALGVADVARLTGISRAASRRCLHTLEVLGYVARSGGVYQLSPRVLTLGYAYLGSAPLARSAQPVLERAAGKLHESCSMTTLDGDNIVYVARAATWRILSVGLAVGSRLPAYCTSMGRVLLAALPEAERAAFLARVKLTPHTHYTITSPRTLRLELERVRGAGFAIVDQELEIGLRAMAVPVRRADGAIVAAINVGVQATRVDRRIMMRHYLPVLRGAADEISLTLGPPAA